jgi:hypothetical protein
MRKINFGNPFVAIPNALKSHHILNLGFTKKEIECMAKQYYGKMNYSCTYYNTLVKSTIDFLSIMKKIDININLDVTIMLTTLLGTTIEIYRRDGHLDIEQCISDLTLITNRPLKIGVVLDREMFHYILRDYKNRH